MTWGDVFRCKGTTKSPILFDLAGQPTKAIGTLRLITKSLVFQSLCRIQNVGATSELWTIQ
jgi:hypothetical protein